MNTNSLRWSAMLTVLLVSAEALSAKCTSCEYVNRGDRREGIYRKEVSGGCCEPMAVLYRGMESIANDAQYVHLHFAPPSEMQPEIVVWQPATNYLMRPWPKSYGPGLQDYRWPRQTVLEQLGIPLESLYALVSYHEEGIYLPASLSSSERPKPTGGYTFVLRSDDPLAVRCTIEREEQGKRVPVRNLKQISEKFGGIFRVEWDGLDDHGHALPPGVYLLQLEGTLYAETIEDLSYSLSFQHYGRLK